MIKKTKYLLFSLLAIALLMVGCSSDDKKSESEDGKITIDMWGYSDYDYLLDGIKEEFPDVDFKYNKLPSGDEYQTKLQTTLIGGGDGPDIVQMDNWIPQFYPYYESFANLYDLGAKDVQDQYLDWKWNVGVEPEQDYMIGFPLDIAPIALYYRADLFEEAGLPSTPEEVKAEIQTLDDLLEAAKQLKEKTGATLDTASENFDKAVAQMEKGFYDEDGNFIGAQDHIKEAWDYAVKTIEYGVAFNDTSSLSRNVAFGNGDIGALIHASWFKGDLVNDIKDTKGDWRVSFPPGGGGNRGGSFLGVSSSSDHQEVAYEIIEYISNADNQLVEFELTGHIPSLPELYDREELQEEDKYFGGQNVGEYYMKSAEDITPSVESPNDSIASDAFKEELDLISNRDKDPDEAWEDALEKIERISSRK